MSLTDEEVVARCLGGDSDAYRHVVQRHQKALMGYLIGRLGQASEAEDAAQEAFVRAYVALDKLNRHGSFFPWLLGIASRVAKERVRERIRQREALTVMAQQASEPAGNTVIDQELRGAVARLPEAYRQAISLRYYGGLSCSEIADRTDKPLGTVTKTLSRAYAELRKTLRAADVEAAEDREAIQ